MIHALGTFLFASAIIGNGVLIAAGLVFGLVTMLGQAAATWGAAPASTGPVHESRAFHHPDHIQTPLGEWVFMAGACAVVLVGLPVALASIFQFVVPMIGRAWGH